MADTTNEPQSVADLVLAFALSAKRAGEAMEERLDWKTQRICVSEMNAITTTLDNLPPDHRAALAPLLDDAELAIRVYAAAYLLKTIPERILPILRQIKEEYRGTHAGVVAMTLLFEHDLRG